MNFPPREIVDMLKEKYIKGKRVKLVHMKDPYRKMTVGMKGTVDYVDDSGSIHVNWDNGGSLAVVYGEDACELIDPVKVICDGREQEFDHRTDALNLYSRAASASEGMERLRYCGIVTDLFLGKDVATDDLSHLPDDIDKLL